MPPKAFLDKVAAASKKYDMRIGQLDGVVDEVPAISTGNVGLDYVLGTGGFPLGRIAELSGAESSGKTTSALQTAVRAQQYIREGREHFKDRVVVYCDFEHALDPDYVRKLGLDADDAETFYLMQPDTLESGTNAVLDLIKTGAVCLVIFDSVAAMTPQGIFDKAIGESTVALRANLMATFLAQLVTIADENKTACIFLNHLMDDMAMGGRPGVKRTKTPGGKALKFFSSIRIEYTKMRSLKGKVFNEISNEEEEMIDSTEVRIRVTKNKLAPPFRSVQVLVRFGKGFDEAYTARQILIGHKRIVEGNGKYFFFDKCPELLTDDMNRRKTGTPRPYIQGDRNFFQFCDTHPEWREQLIKLAQDVLESSQEEPITVSEEDPDDD